MLSVSVVPVPSVVSAVNVANVVSVVPATKVKLLLQKPQSNRRITFYIYIINTVGKSCGVYFLGLSE
jgi:hypothetical protein